MSLYPRTLYVTHCHKHRATVPVAIIAFLWFLSPVYAQSAPPDPDEYPITGVGTIYEGLLVLPSGPVEFTSDPSVAFEVPQSGPARFVASCITNTVTGTPTHNFVLAGAYSGYSDSVPPNAVVGPVVISTYYPTLNTYHLAPSTAMNASGNARVGWYTSGSIAVGLLTNRPELQLTDFSIDSAPSTWPVSSSLVTDATQEWEPSVGVSAAQTVISCGRNTNQCPVSSDPQGLVYDVSGSGFVSIRSCVTCPGTQCSYRVEQWQPCVAMRDDGYFVQVFADAESSADDAPFNIRMRIYEPDGDPVTLLAPDSSSLGTEILVNDPPHELTASLQIQPVVSFDSSGRIIAVWTGLQFSGCTERNHIFARAYQFNSSTSVLTTRSPAFVVDSDAAYSPSGTVVATTEGSNPTVALSKAGNGRFIVAWTAAGVAPSDADEIHAQYFDSNLHPLGCEFRINQVNDQPESGARRFRRLGSGAQHTIDYGPNDEVVCAWSVLMEYSGNIIPNETDEQAYFTMLPPGYADYLNESSSCCTGDITRDGLIDGLDIQPFVTILLGSPLCLSIVDTCPADTDRNTIVDLNDVAPFVTLLLEGATCGSGAPSHGIADCNSNSIPDSNDIDFGTSQDCNANFIPDECDIDANDPDGNGLVSADVNANSVPDECEPDCNHNSIPDTWDITQSTSTDVNTNGVPDECEADCNHNNYPDDYDIAVQTSADCNLNGIPDECEYDCNSNGVPDDCDVDPNDPDGNQLVSPDCNGDLMPDECNLSLPPPYGSFDCNENGRPDECDIACGGGNTCDGIAGSYDANANSIPDECEEFGEGMMMNGQGEFDEESAWSALYEWAAAQCWGPNCETTTAEQFQAYLAKRAELGLAP